MRTTSVVFAGVVIVAVEAIFDGISGVVGVVFVLTGGRLRRLDVHQTAVLFEFVVDVIVEGAVDVVVVLEIARMDVMGKPVVVGEACVVVCVFVVLEAVVVISGVVGVVEAVVVVISGFVGVVEAVVVVKSGFVGVVFA